MAILTCGGVWDRSRKPWRKRQPSRQFNPAIENRALHSLPLEMDGAERAISPALKLRVNIGAEDAIRHTPIEVAESQALLDRVEQQIKVQEQLMASLRASGRPTHRVVRDLQELHQNADRKRDHIRQMRREYDA